MILNTTPTKDSVNNALSSRKFKYKFNMCTPGLDNFEAGDIVEFEYPFGRQMSGSVESYNNLPSYNTTHNWSFANYFGTVYYVTNENSYYIWEGFYPNSPTQSRWVSVPKELEGDISELANHFYPESDNTGNMIYYSTYQVISELSDLAFAYNPVPGSDFCLSVGNDVWDEGIAYFEDISLGDWLVQEYMDYIEEETEPYYETLNLRIHNFDTSTNTITKIGGKATYDFNDEKRLIYAYRNSVNNKIYYFAYDVRYDYNFGYLQVGEIINQDIFCSMADQTWGGVDTTEIGNEIVTVDDANGWFETSLSRFTREPSQDSIFIRMYSSGNDEYYYVKGSCWYDDDSLNDWYEDKIVFGTDNTIYYWDNDYEMILPHSLSTEDNVFWDLSSATWDQGDYYWYMNMTDDEPCNSSMAGDGYGWDDPAMYNIWDVNLTYDQTANHYYKSVKGINQVSPLKQGEVLGIPSEFSTNTAQSNLLTYASGGRVASIQPMDNMNGNLSYGYLGSYSNQVPAFSTFISLMEKRVSPYVCDRSVTISANSTPTWKFYQASLIASGEISILLVNANDPTDTEQIHISFTNNYSNSNVSNYAKVIGGVIKTKFVSDPENLDVKLFSLSTSSTQPAEQILQLLNNSSNNYIVYLNGLSIGDLTQSYNTQDLTYNKRFKFQYGGYSTSGATEYELASAKISIDDTLDPTSDNAVSNSAVCSGIEQVAQERSAVVFRVWPSQI